MGKAGERATSSRRSRSRETFSVFAVIVAVAAVTFGLSSAQAHTTTATLLPDGQGFYTDWANGESAIDESGTPDCGTGESVIEATGTERESVLISLATVPDGATITSVDIQMWHRGDSSAGGTFQAFARLDGTNTDSGTDIAAVGSSGGCSGPVTQSINVADTIKGGGTALEVGVVKTAANGATVRVGAIRATVTYNRGPSAPTLTSPADAASTDDRTPPFDWNDDSVDPDGPAAALPTATTTLLPNGQGFYTAWTNGEDQIDESGTPDCGSGDSVIESTGNDRESVLISLATVPDGATITSVDIQVWHRGDSTAGGTFQTFARLDGTNTDSGTDIAAVGTSGCSGPVTQALNVADSVKAGGTTLEVGVLKTATNAATVRVGAIRAVVNYTPSSEGPFTYDISRAPFVSGACDWGSATTNNVASSQFTPSSEMSLGVHCWRVRTLDHAGLAGPWSAARTLTIVPKDVTAQITAANKVYDGSADADYTCEVVGADLGDDVDCDGDHPASFDTADVGTDKTVTATGLALSGDDSGDYNLTNDSDTDLSDITKADPDCKVNGYSGTYDGDPHGASGSCAGVNEEGPLAGLDLGNSFTNVPGGTANWAFTDQSGNYSDDEGSVEIEITRATLSIDADDKSKDYNQPDPPFTYKLRGFVNGEGEQSAGVTGEATCSREGGESVAGSPYEITCTQGTLDADNYRFETGEAGELTIIEADALVRYIGETVFVSSGSSSTTAKVTLTASLQAVSEQSALGTGAVSFIDANTGKVLAANVPVQPVAGQTNVGTANTSITLSTGQFGAESYLIRVVATGNYTNDDQDDADKTATVVAMKPTTTNSTIGGGTIDPLVPRGAYAGDLDEDATFSIGMQYTSKGTNLKGKITLYVPQADGSIILVKSNSISSMTVTGTTAKTSTIYTKASMSTLDGGVVTAITGSATLRVDVLEPSTGPASSQVGFTVLSSSNSKLLYSNRWVLENNTWKTKAQALESGAVDIN